MFMLSFKKLARKGLRILGSVLYFIEKYMTWEITLAKTTWWPDDGWDNWIVVIENLFFFKQWVSNSGKIHMVLKDTFPDVVNMSIKLNTQECMDFWDEKFEVYFCTYQQTFGYVQVMKVFKIKCTIKETHTIVTVLGCLRWYCDMYSTCFIHILQLPITHRCQCLSSGLAWGAGRYKRPTASGYRW